MLETIKVVYVCFLHKKEMFLQNLNSSIILLIYHGMKLKDIVKTIITKVPF